MITISLRYLCTLFFNLNTRLEDFHTLPSAEILDSFSFARPLNDKVFFQWTDASDVLLAMKYLRETEIVNRPSDETGHLIGGIRSPPDIQIDSGAA